jgi:hypothetical protein
MSSLKIPFGYYYWAGGYSSKEKAEDGLIDSFHAGEVSVFEASQAIVEGYETFCGNRYCVLLKDSNVSM